MRREQCEILSILIRAKLRGFLHTLSCPIHCHWSWYISCYPSTCAYSVYYKELTYISSSCQLSRKMTPSLGLNNVHKRGLKHYHCISRKMTPANLQRPSDSSLEIYQRRGHRHIIWLISFKMYQGIGHLQIIWLVFRYLSMNRRPSNHMISLSIFLKEYDIVKSFDLSLDIFPLKGWHDQMPRLTPRTYTLHCSDVDNHYVIVSSYGTDVLSLLAHITRIPGCNIWMKTGTSKVPRYLHVHIIKEQLNQSFLLDISSLYQYLTM